MTTTVVVRYKSGNKAVEVLDKTGTVVAKLENPGDELDQSIHSDSEYTFRETGEFLDRTPPKPEDPDPVVEPAVAE